MHQSFNSLLTILKWDITALVRKISAPKSASLRKQSITFSRSPTGTPTRLSLRASRRRRRTARWPRPRLPSRRSHCLGNEPRDRGPRARCFPRRRRNHRTHRSKYSRCRMNVQLPQWTSHRGKRSGFREKMFTSTYSMLNTAIYLMIR